MPLLKETNASMLAPPSLAADMESRQVWRTDNHVYKEYTQQLAEKLREIYAREAQRLRTARPAIVVQTLDAVQQSLVSSLYPEFALQTLGLIESPHPVYTAMRGLANEHMRLRLKRTVDTVVHVGDNLVSTAMASDEGISFELDGSNATAMHEAHQASVTLMRMGSDPDGMRKACGMPVPPDIQRKFLAGELYHRGTMGKGSMAQAEGVAIDCTMYPMTVLQALGVMMQAGAVVGEVVVPFHPMMIQLPEGGEIPETGVHYEVTEHSLVLKYPEGVAGLTEYDLTSWHEWLAVSHRQIQWGPENPVFRFELTRPRGCFLHISIVRVPDDTPPPDKSLHTLDLCDTKGKVVVRGWRLRQLGLDPTKPGSWEAFSGLYDQTTVERIQDLAMSLPVGELHVHKLANRANAIGRTVVSGSGVETKPSMSPGEVRDLCVQVQAWAFHTRYEAGKLVGELKQKLDMLCGFSRLSRAQRYMWLLSTIMNGQWESLIGGPNESVRGWADKVRDWFKPNPAARIAEFQPAPQFVTFSESKTLWLAKWRKHASKLRANDYVLNSLRGAYYAHLARVGDSVRVAPAISEGVRSGEDVVDYEDMRAGDVTNPEIDATAAAVGEVADLARGDAGSHMLEVMSTRQVVDNPEEYSKPSYHPDADYVTTLSEFHETVFPGYSGQNFDHDDASLALDPQARGLATDFLTMPIDAPRLFEPKAVYRSKLQAFNREKAAQTLVGTLSAMAARNMADPQLALGQDKENLIPEIFQNFLDVACVPDAKAKIERFKRETVNLSEEAYKGWAQQANPNVLKSIRGQLEANYKAFEERDVGEYIAMLKADVKPPLSTKPLRERTEPQVIVYHEKVLSSLYSSLFRVIRERLLSLLKPNFRLVLIKSMDHAIQFMEDNHPWDGSTLQFLENDFSKYDKSQGDFAFALEEYIFRQLGLNEALLDRWLAGHVRCSLRAFSIGLTLHVSYQRKSGDATTALGNGILNICSVLYAYRGTDIKWAVFMGDDSLVCAGSVVVAKDAPQIMAEIFNLQAKFFITQYPYFASNFLHFDSDRRKVVAVADPVKAIQKKAVSVGALDPQWADKWRSASESWDVYRYRHKVAFLAASIRDRYAVSPSVDYDFSKLTDALATAVETEQNHRALYESRVSYVHS